MNTQDAVTTLELESEVERLLTELSARKCAGVCDRIRVQFCGAGYVEEVWDFRPDVPTFSSAD